MFDPAPRPVWWLPTLGFFAFLLIELWTFHRAERMFDDPGVGRHLRTAEVILETGQIPRTDPLSFTKAGEPWVDYEWAFEATLGELYRWGGLALVCAFCSALFGVTILGIFRTLLHSGFSLPTVLLYSTVAFLTLQLHHSIRPLLFTYLFMALVIEVWHRRTEPLPRDWLFLPVIFAAWANLHAGWAAALVFLVISLLGRLLDRIGGRVDGDEAPLIPWVGLTFLCALATLVNPWGWVLHREIFLFATTYKSFSLWNEYLPPDFAAPSMTAVTILFILFVILVARVFKRVPPGRWESILPILFFLYQGLKAQRHVLLLVEVAAVPVARDLDVLLKLRESWLPFIQDRLRQFQDRQRLAGGDAWLVFVTTLILSLWFVHAPMGGKIWVGKTITPNLVAFVREHPDRFHRPLTTSRNAGPLLWNLRPGFRVSFDDRGDFYGDAAVYSFINLGYGIGGWRETLEKGDYDSALLDPFMLLNQLLPSVPGWREVYRDDKTIVYWKEATVPVESH